MTAFLWSLFDLNGTASRKRGWLVFGAELLVLTMTAIARNLSAEPPLILLAGLAAIVWMVTKVQRLHDAGRSGYWVLATALPIIPSIIILCLPPAAPPPPHPIARRVGGSLLILYAALIASRAFLWHPYFIPYASNEPTLMPGDQVIATRVGTLQRGDMVVFRHPVSGETYVKRLIGMGRDTVQMRSGVVVLNGMPLPQVADGDLTTPYGPSANQLCGNTPGPQSPCITPRDIETLPNGRSYSVLDIETSMQDTTGVFTVPQGMMFVLGDNRDNSLDSRFHQSVGGTGFVPTDAALGRVRWVLFSMSEGLMAGRNWITVQ